MSNDARRGFLASFANSFQRMRYHHKSNFLVLVPLALSIFTHLWNPIGFPYFHGDEGHYLRRALHTLEGLGPQEQRNTTWSFERPYDHPYFGQLFLGSVFGVIDYPDLLSIRPGDVHSIETLHLVPRVLMGMLGAIDTFIVYNIVNSRYNNRKIALIASILFAVLPITWLSRRVLLDSLLLPFLLLSIFFALSLKKKTIITDSSMAHKQISQKKHEKSFPVLLTLLSGIFMGLTIFTKAPAFTMIPLVAYIIYNNIPATRKLKILGLWFIPVISIPLMWPTYAISIGEFDSWVDGLFWQAKNRQDIPIWNSLNDIFNIDPVILLLGVLGLVYSVIVKRDSFTLLWIIPFIIFFFFVDHLRYIYWIPILPVFCIAAAVLIVDLSNKVRKTRIKRILPVATISAIGLFGLIVTTILITSNVNRTFFELYALIVATLPQSQEDDSDNTNDDDNEKAIMMGSNWMQTFSWIPKYIFDQDHDFKTFREKKNLPIQSEKVLLLVDKKDLKSFILSDTNKNNIKQKQLYDDTQLIAVFNEQENQYKHDEYPYTGIQQNPGTSRVEVRTNYNKSIF